MNNERGLTLIELLAVVVITSIVLSVAAGAVHLMYSQWNDAWDDQESEINMRWALTTLSNELSEATQVSFYENELKYRKNEFYSSLYYADHTLTLYDVILDEGDRFFSSEIHPTLTPEKYINPRQLSRKVQAPPTYELPGGPGGQLIKVNIPFYGPNDQVIEKSILVKWLRDGS